MTLEWVLSFPVPLRILFAAHPELLAPVLRIIHRVIASFLLKQTGLKRSTADTGAVSLAPMKGSNGHREWGIFTIRRAIDRLPGRRYRRYSCGQ